MSNYQRWRQKIESLAVLMKVETDDLLAAISLDVRRQVVKGRYRTMDTYLDNLTYWINRGNWLRIYTEGIQRARIKKPNRKRFPKTRIRK